MIPAHAAVARSTSAAASTRTRLRGARRSPPPSRRGHELSDVAAEIADRLAAAVAADADADELFNLSN